MRLVSDNALGILDKLIVQAKQNIMMYESTPNIKSYYEGRMSGLCEIRNWINNKKKG